MSAPPEIVIEAATLTPAQWRQIGKHLKLSPARKLQIASAIGFYRSQMRGLRASRPTKRRIESLLTATRSMRADTRELVTDPAFYFSGGVLGTNQEEQDMRGFLDTFGDHLAHFETMLNTALLRMNNVKRGRKSAEPLRLLGRQLVHIHRQATGKRLGRSYKIPVPGRSKNEIMPATNPFFLVCAQIADANVTHAAAMRALKFAISEDNIVRGDVGHRRWGNNLPP